MKFKNSKTKYGIISKIFHWTIFVILAIQFPLGVYLDSLEFSELKLSIENWHIFIGMIITFNERPFHKNQHIFFELFHQ